MGDLTLIEKRYILNKMGEPARRVNLGDAALNEQTFIGILDATGGKAIGSHYLKDLDGNDLLLPNNVIMKYAIYEVITTFTSATDAGTIGIGVETVGAGTEDLVNAVAISVGTTWDATGTPVETIVDATLSNWIKTTAERKVQANVAVEALTAGKLRVYITCLLSE